MKRPCRLLLPLIASALLFAAGPDEPKLTPSVTEVDLATDKPGGKPACTTAIVGHQWPDEATDPIFAAALAPYGYPMVCTRTGSAYVWRSVTKKSDKPARAAGPVSPRPATPKN